MSIGRSKIFKIVLLGQGGVGKTSLRHQYLGEGFKEGYAMTIGADFAAKRTDVDGETITAQIWDLAGQERFEAVRSVYYRGCTGALLVFDITRPDTYQVIPNWLGELISNNNDRIVPLILIGNKSDLRDSSEDPVARSDAEEYAKSLAEWSGFEVPYVETSALSGVNVEDAFTTLLRNVNSYVEEAERKRREGQ